MIEKELRFAQIESNDGNTLVGYAAKFNSLSEDLGGFREQIAPGAFAKSLADQKDIRAFADHDMGKILGRTKNGTLKLSEDNIGLRMELKLPNTTLGNDIRELVKDGTLNQMSFGFRVRKDSWNKDLRTLHDVDLAEVSVVSIPAYADTSIALRSRQQAEVSAFEQAAAAQAEKDKYEILLKLLASDSAE